MTLIPVTLSPAQRRLLRLWHDTMVDKAGRYGDGTALFPDESAILNKLATPGPDPPAFTYMQLKQMIDWGESATRGAVSIDEERLLTLLAAALMQN